MASRYLRHDNILSWLEGQGKEREGGEDRKGRGEGNEGGEGRLASHTIFSPLDQPRNCANQTGTLDKYVIM